MIKSYDEPLKPQAGFPQLQDNPGKQVRSVRTNETTMSQHPGATAESYYPPGPNQ